jgi:hypothetical protein
VRQSQDRETAERALRERVGRELARHKTMSENFGELFKVLERIPSHEALRAIHSIPDDLRRSSEDLRQALDSWSRFLTEKTVSCDHDRKWVKTVAVDRESTAMSEQISRMRSELAKSRTRLAEREDQIAALINDGLCLAFKKEALEKRLLSSGCTLPARASATSS